MTDRRRRWGRDATRALQSWTFWLLIVLVGLLAGDLISEGPERITAAYLVARVVVFGGGWLGGVFVIRWLARRAADGSRGADDGGA
ncbi:hypothetical protein ACGFI3_17870 [Nonomuraea wenchangensis]|uniref:hypothetical protein n=1 Tax=Nonomuraea wenchangensis TaxID=568860 RepID=UPI0037187F60